MTYQAGGRQFVAIVASGHAKIKQRLEQALCGLSSDVVPLSGLQ